METIRTLFEKRLKKRLKERVLYLNCKYINNIITELNTCSFNNQISFLNLFENKLLNNNIIIKEYDNKSHYIKFGHKYFSEEIEACLCFKEDKVKINFI